MKRVYPGSGSAGPGGLNGGGRGFASSLATGTGWPVTGAREPLRAGLHRCEAGAGRATDMRPGTPTALRLSSRKAPLRKTAIPLWQAEALLVQAALSIDGYATQAHEPDTHLPALCTPLRPPPASARAGARAGLYAAGAVCVGTARSGTPVHDGDGCVHRLLT